MLALTLTVVRLLVSSAGECYLVTSEKIEVIPCVFSAEATDALRYAAEDAEAAKPRKPEPQPRIGPLPQRAEQRGTRRWRSRGDQR